MSLLRFLYTTAPLAATFMAIFTVATVVMQVIGQGHWFAVVLVCGADAALLIGTAEHRRRLEQQQARHNEEAVRFAAFALRNYTNKLLPVLDQRDLERWRKFDALPHSSPQSPPHDQPGHSRTVRDTPVPRHH